MTRCAATAGVVGHQVAYRAIAQGYRTAAVILAHIDPASEGEFRVSAAVFERLADEVQAGDTPGLERRPVLHLVDREVTP